MPLAATLARAKDVANLQVHRGQVAVGSLIRIPGGSQFTYAPEFALKHRGDGTQCVAFSMPVREQPYVFPGANLPPFFAGLLPEGLRYQALVRALDVPSADGFAVLAAVGRNPVGDVWLQPEGAGLIEGTARIDHKDLKKQAFADLQVRGFDGETPLDPMAIPGIRAKLSVGVVEHPLRARSRRRESFLKLSSSLFPKLAENEAFFMAMARSMKIKTADVQVVKDANGQSALLVERFDRTQSGPDNQQPLARIHQEDMCQLLDLHPTFKFQLTPLQVSKALGVCTAPMVERLKFFQLLALSYAIGNANLHGKNMAVQCVEGRVQSTPVYDLHSTLPYGDSKMAIGIGEKDAPILRKELVDLAEQGGVRRRATERMLDSLTKGVAAWIPRLSEIGLPERHTRRMADTMLARVAHLTGESSKA